MSAAKKLADKKKLKNLVPLNGLSEVNFSELIKKATFEDLASGKYLFRQGARDQEVCFLLEGEVELVQGKKVVQSIRSGSPESAHPLAPQQPRQFSARAKSKVSVMRLDAGLLDVMVTWDQSTNYEVSEIETEEDEDWMTRLLQSELLQKLPAMNIQQLIMKMEDMPVTAGTEVITQDSEGDYYYIVKQGRCMVTRKTSSNARPVKLAELRDGDSFGEEALLTGGKRNASVTMMTDGSLMRLAKADFDELLKQPLVKSVNYKQARKLIKNGAVWLDVRLPGEYQTSHLNESINIPLAALREEAASLRSTTEYIVYCDTGRRSASAAFLLSQSGLRVQLLEQGLNVVPNEDIINAQAKGDAGQNTSSDVVSNKDWADSQEIERILNDLRRSEEIATQQQKQITQLQAALESERKQNGRLEKESKALSQQFNQKFTALQNQLEKQKSELADQARIIQENQQSLKKGSVEKQQEEQRAQDYLQQIEKLQSEVEELKEYNQNLMQQVQQLDSLNATVKTAKQEADEQRHQREMMQRDLDELRVEYRSHKEEAKTRNSKLQQTVDDLQAQIQAQLAARQKIEAENQKSNSSQVQAQQTITSLTEQLAVLQRQLEQQGEDYRELIDQQQRNAQELERLLEINEQLSDQYNKRKSDAEAAEKERNARIEELQSENKALAENTAQLQDDFSKQIEQLKQELEVQSTAREEAEQAFDSIGEQQQLTEQALAEAKQTLTEIQAKHDESEQEKNHLLTEIDSLKQNLREREISGHSTTQEAQERIADLESSVAEAKQENLSLKEQLSSLEQSNDQNDDQVIHLREQLQVAEDKLSELERAAAEQTGTGHEEVTRLVAQLESANQEIERLQAKMQEAQGELEQNQHHQNDAVEQLESKLEQASQAQQALQNEVSELEAKLKETKSALSDTEAAFALMEEESGRSKDEIQEYSKKLSSYQSSHKKLEKKITHYKSEIETLNVIKREYEVQEQRMQELQAALDQANNNSGQLEDKLTEKEGEYTQLQRQAIALENEKQDVQQELEQVRRENQTQIDLLQKEAEALRNDLKHSGQSAEITELLRAELQQAKLYSSELETKVRNTDSSIRKMESELALAQQMAAESSNYREELAATKREMEVRLQQMEQKGRDDLKNKSEEIDRLRNELKEVNQSVYMQSDNGSMSSFRHSQLSSVSGRGGNSAFSTQHAFYPEPNEPPARGKGKLIFAMIMVAILFSGIGAGGFWYMQKTNGMQPFEAMFQQQARKFEQSSSGGASQEQSTEPENTLVAPSESEKAGVSAVSQKAAATADIANPREKAGQLKAKKVYRDIINGVGSGPTMVEVPAGSFTMGSGSGSANFDERPQRTVSVPGFSISKHEITYDQYDAFASSTGRGKPSSNGWGRKDRPVINVSWHDAVAYTRWLSQKTGHTYRLATEAEWEYAAKAGTTSLFWWGNTKSENKANCFNCGSQWDGKSTAPVGSFVPNSLGLHDTAGNAPEWVQDCYHANYQGAPVDGSAWEASDCKERVVRGGSYRSAVVNLHSNRREHFSPDTRVDIGFRVVRE